ncbi:MAG: sigma-54 dependent transcriptional regulator [Melioribacteraceae bacterium]
MKINGNINILLIEDEKFDVKRVKNTLILFKEKIFIKEVVSNGIDALKLIKTNPNYYSIVIMDFQIAGGLKGKELIRAIKKVDSTIQIIVITKLTIDISDIDFANDLIEAGAFWYCTKYPGDIEEYIYQPTDFVMSIFNAYEKRILEKRTYSTNKKLTQSVNEILIEKEIVGKSEQIISLKKQIEKLAENEINILIDGASGTGKELVAYHIHYKSKRKFEKFIRINCGSLPNDLVESELFGYEKGSFTGAANEKKGLFEVANKGTIFLDEVSELPLATQVKLLRVIQDGELEKIGRTDSIKVDVRIIAASNKNLEEQVTSNKFREDLYYRLNVMRIHIPPIKERPEDIPILINHYVERYCKDMGIINPNFEDDAMLLLKNYNWRGNVRELKNVVQRLLLSGQNLVTKDIVKNSLVDRLGTSILSNSIFNFNTSKEIISLKEMEKKFRMDYFLFVRKSSNSDAEAAQKLDLAPPNYYRMCKELGLK